MSLDSESITRRKRISGTIAVFSLSQTGTIPRYRTRESACAKAKVYTSLREYLLRKPDWEYTFHYDEPRYPTNKLSDLEDMVRNRYN